MQAFSLEALLTLDSKKFDKGLSDAESKFRGLGSKISSTASTISKITTAAVAAGAGYVAMLTKQATSAYATYEQLSGGIQKLYGNMGQTLEEYAKSNGQTVAAVRDEWKRLETAQNDVLKNAQKAYKTASMSTNEYLENVTGFSAALLNSVDGDSVKAAAIADKAMKDIADNANTFGQYSAQQLADVYKNLAKGQYQTMDNLNLGFGGTKEGLQSLIDKANEVRKNNGENTELVMDNFADVIEAIHVVQQEMNITGTTEREATKTIEGSLNMLSAAWKNLLMGFADPSADLDSLFNAVVVSAEIAFKNLEPVVERVLTSIADLMPRIADIVAEKLPELIPKIIPPLITAAVTIVSALIQALPQILAAVAQALPQILEEAFQESVGGAIGTLVALLAMGIGPAIKIFGGLIRVGSGLMKVFQLLVPVIGAIGSAFSAVTGILSIINPMVFVVIAAIAALIAIGVQVYKHWDEIKEKAVELWQTATEAFAQLRDSVTQYFEEIRQRAADAWNAMTETVKQNVQVLIDAVMAAWNWLIGLPDQAKELGRRIVEGIGEGIKNATDWLRETIRGWVGNVKDFLKALFGIASPSKWAEDVIGENLDRGIGVGIEANADAVYDEMDAMRERISQPFDVSVIGTTDIANGNGYPTQNYSEILDGMSELKELLMNLSVVLDTGETVGVLAPYIDSALGRTQLMKARGG